MHDSLILSELGHTWILDLDGTIVKHNGYLLDGHDTLLDGAKEFLDGLSKKDRIVFLTSRKEAYRKQTEEFLRANGIRWDAILFDMPYGERIVVNDRKPSGLTMGYAVNKNRNSAEFPDVTVDSRL